MRKTYILTRDVNCPVVATGGTAHKQTQMRMRRFRKGQLVKGELKHSNNRPAFVLVGKMCVIPIDAVKEIQGKDIVSKFEGADMDQQKKQVQPATLKSANPKVKYMDALLIGGLVGFIAIYFAEKKGYITSEDNKNKMYGAIGGAVLGAYLVYRHQASQSNVIVKPTTTQKQ